MTLSRRTRNRRFDCLCCQHNNNRENESTNALRCASENAGLQSAECSCPTVWISKYGFDICLLAAAMAEALLLAATSLFTSVARCNSCSASRRQLKKYMLPQNRETTRLLGLSLLPSRPTTSNHWTSLRFAVGASETEREQVLVVPLSFLICERHTCARSKEKSPPQTP